RGERASRCAAARPWAKRRKVVSLERVSVCRHGRMVRPNKEDTQAGGPHGAAARPGGKPGRKGDLADTAGRGKAARGSSPGRGGGVAHGACLHAPLFTPASQTAAFADYSLGRALGAGPAVDDPGAPALVGRAGPRDGDTMHGARLHA